jgi:peptidoglycan/xylan/chitin deacetylase (PgdA/CDA1 family)
MGQTTSDKGPEGRTIICLTYDDAIESQLRIALPQLDSVGFKGTFFLNSIKGQTDSFAESQVYGWKKASQNGHELGNHTMFHPCSEKFGWPKEIAIESYTVDKLLREIELNNQFLDILEEKNKVRAYAYPCNNTMVGGQDYSEKLKDKNFIKYARAGADRTSIIYDFRTVNTMKVPSWLVEEGTTLEELINFAKEVKTKGKMGIYQFHGIGSSYFKVSATTHRQFLEYLKANQADYWVTTFSSAMDYVTSKKSK